MGITILLEKWQLGSIQKWKLTNDTLEYKRIQKSEISDKKYIVHKDLELSNKKSIRSKKGDP